MVASQARGIEDLEVSGQRWVKWLRDEGIVTPGLGVLDFGAGLGRLSIPLRDVGCQVTAIDRRDDMVAYLKEHDIRTLQAEDASVVQGGRFDLAIATYVLQHMGRLRARAIVEQISKVTDRFYFTVPLTPNAPSYHPEQGSAWEAHEACEISYVYDPATLHKRLISPHFERSSPIPMKNVSLWIATNEGKGITA